MSSFGPLDEIEEIAEEASPGSAKKLRAQESKHHMMDNVFCSEVLNALEEVNSSGQIKKKKKKKKKKLALARKHELLEDEGSQDPSPFTAGYVEDAH